MDRQGIIPSPLKASELHSAQDLSVVTNVKFLSRTFDHVPANAHAAICTKPGDPTTGPWQPLRADSAAEMLAVDHNNYANCSSFYQTGSDTLRATKEKFATCHAIVLDDVGTKVAESLVADLPWTWKIETSPGNFQVGFKLATPITDGAIADELQKSLIAVGLCDPGARQPMTRWIRLPVGINGKPEHRDSDGKQFECRLVEWYPERTVTVEQLAELSGVPNPIAPTPQMAKRKPIAQSVSGDDVYLPKQAENPVITKLKEHGLYKTPLGSGKHDITCPWVEEHSNAKDGGTAYFEPNDQFPRGGFCCQHSHGDRLHLQELLEHLDLLHADARNLPTIRIIAGELNRVIEAAEKLLAERGRFFQAGGLIVAIVTDPATGDPAILPISAQALTRELSLVACWEKYDGRSEGWKQCDPPARHVAIFFDAQHYLHMPTLAGLARQPYLRVDGTLVSEPGYDSATKRFGVFDPKQFLAMEPTFAAAQAAIRELLELLSEFRFAAAEDKAAALSAIFTSTIRASLPVAPAFHVWAAIFGSGKTYLCDLISAFAGPGFAEKISYPTTSEEATKVILALLLKGPACIEFDDLDGDWQPFGVIKRMLTAEFISDRVLGVSKTATVSTRTLFLGSGNNCGPIRDLLRRVVTICIDPRVETPATLSYTGDPVAKVRANRGYYVMLVMTVIQAWRAAGCPRANVETIASFSGAWSDYCRHTLIWIGLPDPATSLIQQIKQDPDRNTLAGLMGAWRNAFGSTPTTVRKAVELALRGHTDLLDAIREFPVEERGEINRSKLGWILKKNAGRIVAGFEFQKADADGRTAWRVVPVKAAALPTSPAPFSPPLQASPALAADDGEIADSYVRDEDDGDDVIGVTL